MRSPLIRGTNLHLNAMTLLIATVTAGCGSSSKPVTVVPDPSIATGLPAPAAPGPVNTYVGGQSPGTWNLTLDNTKNAFSYQPLTYPSSPNQPITGNLQSDGGFSSLGQAGLVYEVPGRAAILRPGSNAMSPVFSVPQPECYAIIGKVRFQYIAMFAGTLGSGPDISQNTAPVLGYGSIVAGTDTTGKVWHFENLQGNVVSGPASFSGTCSAANSQAAVSLTGPTVLNNFWSSSNYPVQTTTPTTQSNIWIGPSGFFVADQSDPAQALVTGGSVAGMAEPSSALSTSDVASRQYLGFLYEAPTSANYPNYPATAALTAPVGFGQIVAGSGATMTGGVFPNDNTSGTPNTDIQINLGKEDPTSNGLYTSVSITVLDPAQNCANFNGASFGFPIHATPGVNAQGYITCTFPGVAVAGNPDGNYAIFVNTYNWAATFGGAPMEIFLFQQSGV